jgi:eukaryotic-like serine/threonine-protein kinase
MNTLNVVEAVFFAALEKETPEARAAYLDTACQGDPGLRRCVERLLNAHPRADGFLQAPAPGLPATTEEPPLVERPGTVIGPYKLLQQLGEGGFGVVFLAEQEQPVRRKVALKIIKPGMDSKQVVARFEAERQALALMDHPNIAKVLDAGTTDSGRPFFVMELVKGVPITDFCDQNRLTPRQRLELFVPVCQAIQHAHQKGIIHRDLKPSNVLVASYDDKPVPKVIDFGVAKAIEQKLTEQTLFTKVGQVVGTLEYMSPEQASLNALDVDTRSDVYALGVILYELLTGTTPLNKERLQGVAFLEMLRLIREEEPPRPSTRLSQLGGGLPLMAAYRQVESQKLPKLVRGELDWIAMKALDKERARRYATASALAADVQHYLNDERVEACPPSAGYRLRKFARKNRAAFAAAAVVLAVLLLGIAASTWQALRATWAEADAARQRDAARTAEEKANQQRDAAVVAGQEIARQRDEVQKLNGTIRAAGQELRRNLYFSDLSLIQAAWEGNNVGRALDLLDATRPRGDEEDLRGFEWDYWRRLCHSDLGTVRLFYPHGDETPSNPVFSPNGEFVVGRVAGSGLKVWETATGKPVTTFLELAPNVLPAFSSDGKHLVCWVEIPPPPGETRTEKTLTIKVFETGTGKEVFSLQNSKITTGMSLRPGDDRIPLQQFGLRYSADGTRIVVLMMGGLRVKVWDANDGRELMLVSPLPPPPRTRFRTAYAPALSPDGQEVAAPFQTQRNVDGPGPDRLEENELRILEVTTGKERLRIAMPSHHTGLAYHPDGKRLAANIAAEPAVDGDHDQVPPSVCIWDTATGKLLHRQPTPTGRPFAGLVFSPDGKLLATWKREEPVVYLWDADSGKAGKTIKGGTSPIRDAVFSADGKRLQVVQQDGAVKVWDVAAPAPLVSPDKGATSRDGLPTVLAVTHAGGLRFAVEDRRVLTGPIVDASKPATVAILGPDGREVQRLELAGWLTHLRDNVAFSPDGTALATVSLALVEKPPAGGQGPGRQQRIDFPRPGTLQVWDLATGREVWSLPTYLGAYSILAWHGNRIALTAVVEKGALGLLVLDAATGKQVTRIAHPRHTRALTFSPDGVRLAAYLDLFASTRVMVWDVASGQPVRTFADLPNTRQPGLLAFSPDGKQLAHAHNLDPTLDAQPSTVTVWNLDSGEKRLTLQGQAERIHSLCFSPDGKRLIAAGERQRKENGEIKVWDAASGRELLTLNRDRGLDLVHFSPDGRRLLGVGRDRAGLWLETWDARPLTPEVEGRALLFALAAELPARSEVIARLQSASDLDDAVRKSALEQAATLLHDDPTRLNAVSYGVAKDAGRKPEEYRLALGRAEAAVKLAPQDAMILNTLGAAQYRNGLYREALETLTRSDEMAGGQAVADAAFLALTHYRLGNAARAREYLEWFRKQSREQQTRVFDQELLAEVEGLLGTPAP